MSYNISFLDNSTSLPDVLGGFNNITGGTVAAISTYLIYISLFAILKAKGYDTTASSMATGFVTSIIAAIFWAMGYLSWEYTIIPLITLVGSIVYFFFQD